MRNRWRRLTWPLPTSFVTILALAVLAAAALSSLSLFGWAPSEWGKTSARFREGLVWPGFVAALGAAACAGVHSPRSVIAGPVAGRGPQAIVRRHLIVLIGASWVATTAGMLPAVVRTAQRATYGAPDLLLITSGYAGLAAMVAFGYLVATLVTGRWTYLAVPAGLAAVILAPIVANAAWQSGGRYSLFMPALLWGVDYPLVGWSASPQVSGFRIAFFALLAATFALAAGRWLDGVQQPTAARARRSAAPLAFPLIIAAIAVYGSPDVVRPDRPAAACTTSSAFPEVDICVHQSHADLLPRTAGSVETVLTVIGTTGGIEEFSEDSVASQRPTGVVTISSTIHGDQQEHFQRVVSSLAAAATGQAQCTARIAPSGHIPRPLWESMELQMATADHIVTLAGETANVAHVDAVTGAAAAPAGAGELATLTPASFAQWYRENEETIRACELTAELLP